MKYLYNDSTLKHRRSELRKKQTDAEKVFWSHVRGRQFHGMRFHRQYSIGPYILDFYCPENRIAIELDGGQHNDPEKIKHDALRSEYIKAQGIDILRFWDHEILLEIQAVLDKIEERFNSLT